MRLATQRGLTLRNLDGWEVGFLPITVLPNDNGMPIHDLMRPSNDPLKPVLYNRHFPIIRRRGYREQPFIVVTDMQARQMLTIPGAVPAAKVEPSEPAAGPFRGGLKPAS